MTMATRLLAAWVISAAAAGTSQAATYHGDGYTLNYAASNPFAGFLPQAQGIDRSFAWSVTTQGLATVAMVTEKNRFDLRTVALPDLTLTADPGYQFSDLSISFDGYVYGFGATRDMPLLADVFLFDQRLRIDGIASQLTGQTNWITPGSYPVQSYWHLTTTASNTQPFSAFSFGGDLALVLDGSEAGSKFSFINQLGASSAGTWPMQVRFKVNSIDLGGFDPSGTPPVPEPATWASLLLGLVLMRRAKGRRKTQSPAPAPGARRRRAGAAALLATLAGAPLSGQAGVVCPATQNMARGVDVSVFNGNIDWGAVAGSGISFGVAKAVEGTGFVDPSFARNWAGMGSAGLVRAAYANFRGDQDPLAQAQLYLSTVGDFGSGTLPPILAVLSNDGQLAFRLLSRVDTWLSTVQAATGRTPVVLTSTAV